MLSSSESMEGPVRRSLEDALMALIGQVGLIEEHVGCVLPKEKEENRPVVNKIDNYIQTVDSLLERLSKINDILERL